MVTNLLGVLLALGAAEAPPFPHVQAVPMPDRQVAFQIDGCDIARYHYDPSYHRPFVFPLVGPAGRPLLRLTHPHDPEGHGHHLGIWVAHKDVNGVSFWENGPNRIVHESIETYADGVDAASLTTRNLWRAESGAVLLNERRTTRLQALPGGERYLDVLIELTPANVPVTFGKTPFGFMCVRVAKTMSVNDGDGVILNSEGATGEEQVFWKRARWVDYTGSVAEDCRNGITLFDHPSNPGFPTPYHVRSDGWMGASFCCENGYDLPAGQTLRLKYRLYAHDGTATTDSIESHWRSWAEAAN